MKKLLIFFFALTVLKANSQNEFANENFYSAFRKIVADGQMGFKEYKGTKKPNMLLDGLIDEYKVKLMLPGSDSGEVVSPIIGGPYATYYFKPSKTKAEAQQKLSRLKAAVQTAIGKNLYEKAETSTIKDFTSDKVYYFISSSNTSMILLADFQSGIYEEKGVYRLSFQVNGILERKEVEKKSKLVGEIDLNGKIQTFLNDASSYFSSLKGAMVKSDQYGQDYETKMTLFGLKGKVEDRKLECDLRYDIGFTEFKDLDEANQIFNQLKTALTSALSGKINFGAEEQSKYNDKSYSIQGLDAGSSFIQSRNIITLTINREKDYPAVYLTFNRKKY